MNTPGDNFFSTKFFADMFYTFYLAKKWSEKPLLLISQNIIILQNIQHPRKTAMTSTALKDLQILLAAPRGFCAGVDRAIQIVELAIEKYGAPVYVRHEIVHNQYVVDGLKAKGAIFVEELDEIPDTNAPVIFSAHGVAKSVPEAAKKNNFFYIDATCPLVSKVHMEAERLNETRAEILLIGHEGHPEVIGTMGQLASGVVKLIETEANAENFTPQTPENLAFITQTTLSVDDTEKIVAILKRRFPSIRAPHKEDICYATTNRQAAVKAIAGQCDCVLVVGAPNSSNSRRLVEVAERAGASLSLLVQSADDIPWDKLGELTTLGITAGASAPEILVDQIIEAFKMRYRTKVEIALTAKENISFKLPKSVRQSTPTYTP